MLVNVGPAESAHSSQALEFSSIFFYSLRKMCGKIVRFPVVCVQAFSFLRRFVVGPSMKRNIRAQQNEKRKSNGKSVRISGQVCWFFVYYCHCCVCANFGRTTFSYLFPRWASSFCVVIAMVKRRKAKFAKQIKTTAEKNESLRKIEIGIFFKVQSAYEEKTEN